LNILQFLAADWLDAHLIQLMKSAFCFAAWRPEMLIFPAVGGKSLSECGRIVSES
jgi:hypothetical protein